MTETTTATGFRDYHDSTATIYWDYPYDCYCTGAVNYQPEYPAVKTEKIFSPDPGKFLWKVRCANSRGMKPNNKVRARNDIHRNYSTKTQKKM